MDVGIIIPSYDGYADIWPIAAELFNRYWPDRPYPMYWMCNDAQVPQIAKPLAVPKIAREEWGNNVADAVERMPEPLVLFWVEEIFLLSKVPNDLVAEAAQILNDNLDVGLVALTRYYARPTVPTIGNFTDHPRSEWGFSSALPAIFRKEVLIHLLRTLPQSNDFEQQSQVIMFQHMPGTRSLVSCKPMFRFCDNALLKGPWRECAVKHMQDNGFVIDFSIRGISPDKCRYMDGTPE